MPPGHVNHLTQNDIKIYSVLEYVTTIDTVRGFCWSLFDLDLSVDSNNIGWCALTTVSQAEASPNDDSQGNSFPSHSPMWSESLTIKGAWG